MQKEEIHRYLLLIILLALATVSFFIIRSYIIALIGAFILTYLVYPVHKKLEKKFSSSVAASITLLGTIVIIFLPIILIIKEIILQISGAIQSGAITNIVTKIESLEFIKKYGINLTELTNKFFEIGINNLSSITISVATSIVALFVMGFTMYYLLLNWQKINTKIKRYIPFKHKEKLIADIANTTKKIVHGTLLLAVIESIIAGIGFWLAGIDSYLILAALTGLFAFIPGGPAIVWAPALIFKIVQGQYLDSAIILIFGLFVSIYLDTILRTKVAGKNSRVHPVILLLGVLGGTPIFGIAGIVVGPLLLSYTLEILEEVLNQP
ncbi:AI-2E family transporter [Candidatus Pacearchaeota archaeon]|nr:AI-2E family transporter [Candidatus Pacearchaeota archaeon]